MSIFKTIQPGSRVTIQNRFGQTQTGRAVMFNKKFESWVLNMGGPHGTPGLATEKNTVAVLKPRKGGFTAIARILNGGACA